MSDYLINDFRGITLDGDHTETIHHCDFCGGWKSNAVPGMEHFYFMRINSEYLDIPDLSLCSKCWFKGMVVNLGKPVGDKFKEEKGGQV